jgi:acetate kinase
MDAFGLMLNPEANDSTHAGPKTISQPDSKIVVYVLPADEDRIIAGHVARLAAEE